MPEALECWSRNNPICLPVLDYTFLHSTALHGSLVLVKVSYLEPAVFRRTNHQYYAL